MFAVVFEVHPKPDQWDEYLANAGMLKPELEQINGFVDNIRYKSLTRNGWILSLSGWHDEKALIRWRTRASHHDVQARGRDQILLDYHLRVGQLTHDSAPTPGLSIIEQRLDETETGAATALTLISARRPAEWVATSEPAAVADWLGLPSQAAGLVSWDVFDAVLTPGDVILLMSWRDHAGAAEFANTVPPDEARRLRSIRVVRDYGMFDRREAPQYYPDAEGAATLHA